MYPISQIRFTQADVANPQRRKAVFREAGKTLTWAKDIITDRPGAIARLMELAFEAGRVSANTAQTHDMVGGRRMRDIDVPSLSRAIFVDLRRNKVGASPNGRTPWLQDFCFILLRGNPHLPTRLGRDRWVENGRSVDFSRSNKAIRPLIKLGLFQERRVTLTDGSLALSAELTEWGVELLLTGATALTEDRVNGASSTFQSYRALAERCAMPTSPGMLTVWDLQSKPAAFVLEHRVGGIGRQAGSEGDVSVADIAYQRETCDGRSSLGRLETWRLCRPNLDVLPLFSDDVAALMESGLLIRWDEHSVLLSEWGFELITTGQTAVVGRRHHGGSATYRQYQAIMSRHAKR